MDTDDIIKDKRILDIINNQLTPKDIEKKTHGEVFTPLKIIYEMLSKLPVSVWKDKHLKWLDPANGIGNYPIVVYYKLMEGLRDSIPDEKQRSLWIIEEMIYMNELNPVNISLSKTLFQMIDSDSTPNIIEGDFTENYNDIMKNKKFDIIIGNPPYNSVKTKNIWTVFITTSLSILNKDGYLLFINPASWTGFKTVNSDIFKNIQIEYVRYYNYTSAHKLFGRQSGEIPLTYYLLKNTNTKNNTTIHDNATNTDEEFNIYENNIVPTESISMWKKILPFIKQYGNLKSKYSTVKKVIHLSDTSNSTYKFPIVSIVNKKIKTQYSSVNYNKNNDKKLILTNVAIGYPIYDYLGIMYPLSTDRFILYSNNDEKELKQLQNYFLTNLLFYIINITKSRQSFFNNKLFEMIPDITKITNLINIDDNFLINLFGLTTTDLIGYNHYLMTGEGRLTESVRTQIKDYTC